MPVWCLLYAGYKYAKLNVQKQVVLMLWSIEVFFYYTQLCGTHNYEYFLLV